MELRQITERVYFVEDTTNIGLINSGNTAIIFDSPIDRDKAKKVKRIIDSNGFVPSSLLLSHHHADHTGGAKFFKEAYNLRVLADPLEKVFIENPFLEPVYLAQGASPPQAFLTKWVTSNPVYVDGILQEGKLDLDGTELRVLNLSGHSIGMIGIMFDGVVFAADSFFSTEILEKYGIPYFHNMEEYLKKMNYLKALDFEYILPSHGRLLSKANSVDVIEENMKTVESTEQRILEIVSKSPATLENVITMLDTCKDDLVVSALIRSSVSAILFSMERRGLIEVSVRNCVTFYSKRN